MIIFSYFVTHNAYIFLQKRVSKTTYVYNKEELLLNKITTVNVGWIDSPDKIYVSKVK